MTAVAACGQEVTFVVHDDEAVGLDGLNVVLMTSGSCPTPGSCWLRPWRSGSGLRISLAGWCACAGIGQGDGRLVIDVDTFVGEVCGRLKQGAAYGYTKVFGYHPLLATRADTREILHIRLRIGSANTQ